MGESETANAGTLHEELVAAVRDYLVEGHVSEGGRIPERELCLRFRVSRTPLREALKVLAAEGLIDLLPNRGARLRALTQADIEELFDVIGGLEALAGRLACERITEAELAEIVECHHAMYRAYLRRDLAAYFKLNQDIHHRIVAAARNATLSATYASLSGRLRRVRYAANLDGERDRWGEAMREHEAILDALARRDGRDLSEILFRHLRNKLRSVAGQDALPALNGGVDATTDA